MSTNPYAPPQTPGRDDRAINWQAIILGGLFLSPGVLIGGWLLWTLLGGAILLLR